MTFNSFSYFLFVPLVYLIYFFTVDRWRWFVLLISSYAFYLSFNASYLLIVLLMVTIVSYACGLRISAQKNETLRKFWFWAGCLSCVAILVVMKYLPLDALKVGGTLSPVIVSIGVSYFTFQAISYLTDLYLDIATPEHHLGYFALYMSFFPKLLQGPIERVGDLLPQFKQQYKFDYYGMRSGLVLFTWGLFKKMVIADRLSLYANQVYNNVHDYSGLPLIIGTYAYAFQIFFDFSAYTDMARGTGRIFGINLTENFNNPYYATSIADFWRRWHISFSKWILDYIFKPLQMMWRNRGAVGTASALIVTFTVSGVWHGASWGFVIWGLIHGLYLAISTFYRPYQKRLYKWLGIEKSAWLKWWQVFVTFNLVSFAWIFFRANNVGDAIYVIRNLIYVGGLSELTTKEYMMKNIFLSQTKADVAVIIMLIILYFSRIYKVRAQIFEKPLYVRWCAYIALVFGTLMFAGADTGSFLYMKF